MNLKYDLNWTGLDWTFFLPKNDQKVMILTDLIKTGKRYSIQHV